MRFVHATKRAWDDVWRTKACSFGFLPLVQDVAGDHDVNNLHQGGRILIILVRRDHRPLFALGNEDDEIFDLFSLGGSGDISREVTYVNGVRGSAVRTVGFSSPQRQFLQVERVGDIRVNLRLIDV